MAKASEGALGDLHEKVATALVQRIEAPLRTDSGTPIPGTEGCWCSSSDLQAAITFLKNNNITADPETNVGLAALKDKLQQRRDRGKRNLSANPVPEADLEGLDNSLGGLMQ
jgi:hypothetical protein